VTTSTGFNLQTKPPPIGGRSVPSRRKNGK
jgi:hypothetical protein